MSDITEEATVRPFTYVNEYERDPVVVALRHAMRTEELAQKEREETCNVEYRELQQANAVAAVAQNKYDATVRQLDNHKYNMRVLKRQEQARIKHLKDQDGMDI